MSVRDTYIQVSVRDTYIQGPLLNLELQPVIRDFVSEKEGVVVEK